MTRRRRLAPDSAIAMALAYSAITIVMTWPLARRLTTDIAWDLGDPVYNAWILMWTGGQVLKFLSGDINAIHEYWNGNIFAPERLTIAYSEHLAPQMAQILPLWAATGNIVLCYNLLYLSTFVLSGVAAYLLVRDLTGRPLAAFLAGLAFAFAPYRLAQGSHIQMLSSYWMPLALLGFRRYFVTGRTRPLVGGAAALTLQNLSCGYYLLFFPPFAAAYCIYEMATRRLLRDWRVWRSLAIAAVAVVLVTWPFVAPYLKLRHIGTLGVRSYEETVLFSADTFAFGTVSGYSKLLGETVRAFPKGESEGFMGFAVLALAAVAVAWGVRRAARSARWGADTRGQRVALAVLAGLLAIDVALLLWMFVFGALPFSIRGRPWHDTDPLFWLALGLVVVLVAAAPAARRFFQGEAGSPFGFFAGAAVVAALLALGPRIQSAGRVLGAGPYAWLYWWVPGFDGIRVPARYFMLVALFLAVLAGLGAAALLAWRRRAAVAVIAVASIGVLAEGWAAPIGTNMRLIVHGLEKPPPKLEMGASVGPLYQWIKTAPGSIALIEFPFGEPAYDIMAAFYAGYHRRPLLNGYGGFFPESFLRRATFLNHIPFDLDAATKTLKASRATHAIVHEAAFVDGRGHEITDWLRSLGATVIMTDGTDKLLTLR